MHEIDLAVKKTCRWYPDCFMDLFYGRNRSVKLVGVEDAQIQKLKINSSMPRQMRIGARI